MSNTQTAGSKLTNSVRRAKTAQTENKVAEEEKKATTTAAPKATTTTRRAPAKTASAKPAAKPAPKTEQESETIKPMGSNQRVWPD
ncbi:hypothetical protein [Hydrogenovibrio marinus]|uniref:hypothetical protein n=1 Tax=Hydrogenovibrio marinus TaxID=28885 RepID=UPI0004A75B27|nr:hypothetical protein [Hydrogenovibrio marinus]BBN59767.1 hypothetical protein HVMH_1361 [Hydrogenovibrio marinus]